MTRSKAPIAIFAFKRLNPLARTLKALEACPEFENSPIYVFADAARKDQPAERKPVSAVRDYLRSWCLRHDAELAEAEINQGLRSSIISGISNTFRNHDRVIVLEDDIVVSPSFLTFMNEALSACEEHPSICQISGYFYPHRENLPTVGLLRLPASWGWATWRRAWQDYRDDAPNLLNEVSRLDREGFNFCGAYDHLGSLRENALGQDDTWLVRWYASLFLKGGLTLYPGESLTRNIGFDREGTHCKAGRTMRAFNRQRIRQSPPEVDWENLPQAESQEFVDSLVKFYRWQLHEWTRPSLKERFQARLKLIKERIQGN